MWGENLLFATREEAADRHLFALAVMSDTSHDYTDAKVLQNWLSGVIGHLEALPESTQIALGLPLFKIGDEHFHWRADQIKSWHKERCRSLRQQLAELQREQWQSPVGALPSRFSAPNILERSAHRDPQMDCSPGWSGGPLIKISAAERPNFVLGQLTILGAAIFVVTFVGLTLWLAN